MIPNRRRFTIPVATLILSFAAMVIIYHTPVYELHMSRANWKTASGNMMAYQSNFGNPFAPRYNHRNLGVADFRAEAMLYSATVYPETIDVAFKVGSSNWFVGQYDVYVDTEVSFSGGGVLELSDEETIQCIGIGFARLDGASSSTRYDWSLSGIEPQPDEVLQERYTLEAGELGPLAFAPHHGVLYQCEGLSGESPFRFLGTGSPYYSNPGTLTRSRIDEDGYLLVPVHSSWLSESATIVLALESATRMEVELPAQAGATAELPEGFLHLLALVDSEVDGERELRFDNGSGIFQSVDSDPYYGDPFGGGWGILQMESMMNPPPPAPKARTRLVFTIQPPSAREILSIQAVTIDGAKVNPTGKMASVFQGGGSLYFDIPASGIASFIVSVPKHLYTLTHTIEPLPGIPPENLEAEDLFDVRVGYARFDTMNDHQSFLSHQLRHTFSSNPGDVNNAPEFYPVEFRDATYREMTFYLLRAYRARRAMTYPDYSAIYFDSPNTPWYW